MNIDKVMERSGIQLDIGCGNNKQGPDWVGIDIQPLDGVDIVWDFNIHPWPLPDESCIRASCSHVIEHIPPVMVSQERGTWFPFIEFMDEVWRLLKPDGQFAISTPYATSKGMFQDPTHVNWCNEDTWLYFDPLEAKTNGVLYPFYRPKPWKIAEAPAMPYNQAIYFHPAGNLEVLLIKRREDRSYYE